VQVIEVHHVVVDVLRPVHQVADELGIARDLDAQGVLDRAHRGKAVHEGADPADALREGPGVAGVAAFQDGLDAAHHGPGAVGLGDVVALHLGLDAQMPLDAGDGVDDDAFTHDGLSPAGGRRTDPK
jgi:hypothetical protein